MSRFPGLVYAFLVVLVLASAWYWLSGSEKPAAATYSLAKVTRGDLTATVSATGSLSPVITVQVGSQVSGTIQHLYANFNSRVKQGEVIAQIDAALFKAGLAEAEANLKSAEASRDKASVAVAEAKRQLDRVSELRSKNLVSESDLDTARFAYDAAVVEHRVQQSMVAQAVAARDRQKVNLDYTTIYAPIDGVVISRDVDVGQTVAASLQAPTLFTIAQDLSRMQIETDVDEAFIGMINEGQPVHFTVFAYPSRMFHGEVSQVRLQPKVEAGVVKYNCIILVDNSDLALKPGMTATVAIEVAHRENILKVPNSALRYVPAMDPQQLKQLRDKLGSDEAILWTEQDKVLQPLVIKTGLIGETETEVSAATLREGMPVAVPGERQQNTGRRRGLSLF